jgi:hypothetical protein
MSYSDSFKKFLLKEEALEAERSKNYMFFSNLKQIHRQCEILLKKNEEEINALLENGHDWAEDHIAASTETIDQVFDFMMNELTDDISEMSVAAGAGPYDTPNAFGDVGDDTIEMLGYKRVKKNKSNVAESTFMKLSSQLHLK